MTTPEYKSECCGNCDYFRDGLCLEPLYIRVGDSRKPYERDECSRLDKPTTVRKEEGDV